jgi:hypothetical protein
MQAGSPSEIAAVVDRVDAGSELRAIARLLSFEAPPRLPSKLDDPAKAVVTPVDQHVLEQAALAFATYKSQPAHPDDRTRAQAYLAKLHLHALQGLGVEPGRPLDPFARLLAARAVHHGRTFCRMYWQRRVVGLAGVFADTQERLITAVLALESSPHGADAALAAVERQRGRRYVHAQIERMRTTKSGREQADEVAQALLPFAHEVDRLMDHGFVDLAITRALHRGAQKDGFGLGPAVGLARAALNQRGLSEYDDKLQARLADARRREPAPAQVGPNPPKDRRALAYPQTAIVATQVNAWLQVAAHDEGFPRKYALVRALLLLRDRPEATGVLSSQNIEEFRGLLRHLAAERGDDTLARARRGVADDTRFSRDDRDDKEANARRRYALAAREAGRLPR